MELKQSFGKLEEFLNNSLLGELVSLDEHSVLILGVEVKSKYPIPVKA